MDLSRLEILVGQEKLDKIKNTTVLVIGLGGVGSYAIETLVRSGIKKIVIVDNGVVSKSNINRQLIANEFNIGKLKTEVTKNRVKDINKEIEVIIINEFINIDNIDLLFAEDIDYVVDAIDTIETKKEIIRQTIKRNIKLITCMGTGRRFDATQLKIVNLKNTSKDPVARIIRKMIKDEGITSDIMSICSEEQPIKQIGNNIGSNSFVPSVAGILCTNYIIRDIIDA